MKSTLCLVIAVVFTSVSTYQSPDNVIACGRQLSEVRQLVCSKYSYDKRSQSYPGLRTQADANLFEEDGWPMLDRQNALNVQQYRPKRGLVDECCTKLCNLSEIVKYC